MFFETKQSRRIKFENCIKPQLDNLYKFAYRLTQSPNDAEDLVHDLLLKTYSGATDVTKLDNPRTWLNKVMYRIFIDKCRQNSRSPILQSINDDTDENRTLLENCEDGSLSLEKLTEQQRFVKLIQDTMKELSEEHRILISMYEIEGYSLNEIHEILDIPMGTLKSRLHRARQKLRDLLAEGSNWADIACLKQRTNK